MTPLVLLLLLGACTVDPDKSPDTALPDADAAADEDGDGYRAAMDCDDADASTHPGGTELCDGVDNDCDGNTDEDSASDATTWYPDEDGDGYGDADADTTSSCEQPDGYVSVSGDCDDADAGASPSTSERCADEVDNDCDGETDEESDEDDVSTWYRDSDGDGYGDADQALSGCSADDDYVTDATDCDDADESVNPGADETCDGVDDDCDGDADEDATDRTSWYADKDGDGYGDPDQETQSCEAPSGAVSDGTDCDDDDATVNPGATESCDAVDDDCDGETDEGLTIAVYQDADDDGYGDADTEESACSLPDGYALDDSDCDDADAEVNPGATETCNGLDDDCDGETDGASAQDAVTWYADEDDDGYGDPDRTTQSCATDSPDGYVDNDEDCDDDSPYVRPGVLERCDDKDNDCDGEIDESSAVNADTWYRDADDDGYGDASETTTACDSAPDGYVSDFQDCDDDDADINPDATEACDGVDDDCDGTADDGAKTTYYVDLDGDGYGDGLVTYDACSTPSGYVENADDCDDDDDITYPGATEVCDGIMNDCEADAVPSDETDEDGDAYVDCDTWAGSDELTAGDCDDDDDTVYPGAARLESGLCTRDDDGDGYGDLSVSGDVDAGTDCDDSDDQIFPGVAENDGDLCTQDQDGDGYGDSTVSGALDAGTDCEDEDDTIYPGAATAEPSLCAQDEDGDGYGDEDADAGVDDGTDCDDADGDIYPGAATEESALCTRDQDGDGWGDADVDRGVDEGSDCDDADEDVSPDATEFCDYVDNDCDGEEDEDDAKDASTWYADADADNYGDKSSTTKACHEAPDGYSSDKTDCDDDDEAIHPGADESCDSIDNDCDGSTDEGVTTSYYPDGDGDGYGDEDASVTSSCTKPTGYVTDASDCDDDDAENNPGASESCDSVDNDCDGVTDEGVKTTFTVDADGDGYGDETTGAATTSACTAPTGYAEAATDCDDEDGDTYPDAPELCDDLDNDCDDLDDEGILGHYSGCAADDCAQIYDDGYDSNEGSGYYYVYWNGSASSIYCLMDHETESGGWTRITYQDWASSTSYSCSGSDSEWTAITSGLPSGVAKACYRAADSSSERIRAREFDTGGISYSMVLGYVEGYEFGSMDAFNNDGDYDDITQYYMDGLSITLDDPTDDSDHIYSFAIGLYATKDDDSSCPESMSGNSGDEPADWLEDDGYWTCESGNTGSSWDEEIYEDLLFEDEYFARDLGFATTRDIDVRIMSNDESDDEDLYLTRLILYVQ